MPRFVAAFHSLGLTLPWALRFLDKASSTVDWWVPILPGLLLLLFVAGDSRESDRVGWSRRIGFLRWLPWTRTILRGYEAASFAETLAALDRPRRALY